LDTGRRRGMIGRMKRIALIGLFVPAIVASAWRALPMAAPAAGTFHKHVLPILQKNCQGCHRPGEVAPFSLLTYQDARPYARAIRSAVLSRQMAPWVGG